MKKAAHRRILVLACACVVMALALSGCQTIRFYSQAVSGQYEILVHQKPIDKLIKNPGTDPKLKAQLELVLRIRAFAERELSLRPGKSYLKYADLHRPFVVWNVNVAPQLSLQPKTWWFPIVGRASYRGYFSEAGARYYAEIWEKKGWDTYVSDVPTYSTLGWFRDPLLNTFIFEPEADLADTIFHELTHERIFIAGDTDFNEALATTVAQEGVRRWFEASTNTIGYKRYQDGLRHDEEFVKLVLATREELQRVYDDIQLLEPAKLQRKAEVINRMRAQYAALKKSWGESKSGYDYWFDEPINNAKLNTVAAYYDLGPAFQGLLRAQGGDLGKFYEAVEKLGQEPLEKRHDALQAYLERKQHEEPPKSH
jgi:predicted aminopeptidase